MDLLTINSLTSFDSLKNPNLISVDLILIFLYQN